MVSNLLSNAAKYTPAGGQIRLAARVVDGFVEIEVSDNGIGIPDEMRSKIFELFAQVKSPVTRAQEGLGIGLALVKELVELHGGTITLKSSGLNLGSSFQVSLPVIG
jgi:signal transduction histidine kinase